MGPSVAIFYGLGNDRRSGLRFQGREREITSAVPERLGESLTEI